MSENVCIIKPIDTLYFCGSAYCCPDLPHIAIKSWQKLRKFSG